MGILKSMLDAIMGQVDLAAGRSVTKLTTGLSESDTASMSVESTLRFGEQNDGASDARLLVNGEIIYASGRTSSAPFEFTGLTRGAEGTDAADHPIGTLVVDLSENRTALDLVRRGFLVDYAVGRDLDIIARNLGMKKCPSIDDETWRRIIKAVAYLPKTTVEAFDLALEALTGDADAYDIVERLISSPYEIFVAIETELESGLEAIRGSFFLTGGYQEVTTGLTTVVAPYNMRTVRGVFLDTVGARRGFRDGLTNYYSTHVAGTDTITLSPSPGPIGTAVIIDGNPSAYLGGVSGFHHLATGFGADELVLDFSPDGVSRYSAGDITAINTIQLDDGDRWSYLSDPLLAARCLLDEIRQAGTKVTVSTKL